MIKQCRICVQNKTIDNFYNNKKNKDGKDYSCKDCRKNQAATWNKQNKEKRVKIRNKNNSKNKEKYNKSAQNEYWADIDNSRKRSRNNNKKYYEKNKEKENIRSRAWKEKNKNKVRQTKKIWHNKKMQTDIVYKLSVALRSRLNKALKGNYKSGSAVRDLGCSIKELKLHLESLLQPGMTWGNYGKWHIDHIRPLAAFNLADRDELLSACNYKNLQPLWAEENLRKNKY